MAGAGKSTLGNFLVLSEQYPDEGGFAVGHGVDSKTTHCRGLTYKSGNANMTVYDTPGVPDTDKGKTLQRFNEIVRMVRGLPMLKGIVFLLEMERQQEAKHYEAYRILFRQYAKLPCPLVMVCRVDFSGCQGGRKRQKEIHAFKLIDRVIENCNLKSARVHKFIYGNGDVGKNEVKKLRYFLGIMPGMPMTKDTLMTSLEMEERLCRLSHQEDRIEELKKEIPRLEKIRESFHAQIAILDERIGELEEKVKKENAGNSAFLIVVEALGGIAASMGCPPGIVSVASSRGNFSVRWRMVFLQGFRKIITDSSISNAEELAKVMKEVESGTVDPKELENAREEHQQILKLTKR